MAGEIKAFNDNVQVIECTRGDILGMENQWFLAHSTDTHSPFSVRLAWLWGNQVWNYLSAFEIPKSQILLRIQSLFLINKKMLTFCL